jgi:isoquinoline 1-oxidoreductase subunit alpha
MAALSINGKTSQADVDDGTPLLWVLRDTIGLTGTKYGCGIAQCGACTVHVDGVAMLMFGAAGRSGRQADHHNRGAGAERRAAQGAEGLARPRRAAMRLLPEWYDHGGGGPAQSKPKPTDADIDANVTNICRCGTFQQVRAAIHAAASA